MTRKIIATIVAAALAVTTVNAGTAQAGDREVARIIVGATALAIIGSALAAEQRKQGQVTRHYTPAHKPQYKQHHRQPQHYGGKHHDRNYQHTKQYSQRQYKPVVSRECLMSVRGQRGWTQGYAVRCAQNTTRAALPSNCVRRNYAQGPRLFYSPQCLRQSGFNA